jgi:hypothetical protein
VADRGPRDPDHHKALLPAGLGIVHATVEVHEREERPATRARAAVLVT